MTITMAQSTSVHACSALRLYKLEFPACQAAECFKILGLRALHHFVGQARRGRLLVPMDRFKIIAHELLVE